MWRVKSSITERYVPYPNTSQPSQEIQLSSSAARVLLVLLLLFLIFVKLEQNQEKTALLFQGFTGRNWDLQLNISEAW